MCNRKEMTDTISPEERRQAIDLLFAERCSCVIRNGDELRLFRERGVKDLYCLLKEMPELLKGAFVADKVVGKAAAALMVVGGVTDVFAGVMSTPARDLLQAGGVETDCLREVPHIVNRTQTGWCPLETLCFGLRTPEECLIRIETFLNGMNAKTE